MNIYLRLEGGAAADEGTLSSGSLERFLPVVLGIPRLAAAMLGRSGELWQSEFRTERERVTLLCTGPGYGCTYLIEHI